MAALVGIATPGQASALNAATPDFLADCVAAVERAPEDYETYSCVYTTAMRARRTEEARQAVLELRDTVGIAAWWTMILGHFSWGTDQERAIAHYLDAAEQFQESGIERGEVVARYNLRNLYHRLGRAADADAQIGLAVAAGERSADKTVLAQALTLQATHWIETAGDLAAAEVSLQRAERSAFPDGSYSVKKNCLMTLGNLEYRLGRFDQALRAYRRMQLLADERDDPADRATTAYNLANTKLRLLEEHPEPQGLSEVESDANLALELSSGIALRNIEVRSHRLLGEIAWRTGRFDQGQRHLDSCLSIARQIGHKERELSCLFTLAENQAFFADAGVDLQQQARSNSLAAIDLAQETANDYYLAYAWRTRMRVAWQGSKGEDSRGADSLSQETSQQALEESIRALGAIERLRDAQREENANVGQFSRWTSDYYWLVGRLLSDSNRTLAQGKTSHIAFGLAERMRGQRLLEELERSDAQPKTSEQPLNDLAARELAASELREQRGRIVALQRQLLRPKAVGQSDANRQATLRQLADLEAEERALTSRQLQLTAPRLDPLELASIEKLQLALSARQVILAFMVGLDRDLYDQPAGGSWLFTITRNSVAVDPLPDRKALETDLPILLGLIARRDGQEHDFASRLAERLLGDALARLEDDQDQLILIPDGPLHHLPWSVLPTPGEARTPLGASHNLSLAPSATLWLRWHETPSPTFEHPALVLADPDPDRGNGSVAFADERSLSLTEPGTLGRLPGAEREAAAIRRALGRDTRVLLGAAASEAALATIQRGQYQVLHLAAHALADEAHPQRSSVVLAPGSGDDDGLLQVNEVAALPLSGSIVVLSACSTAVGQVRGGEGVLSLARAFFVGGARTVVATRWPLRDDEAVPFFEHFYRRLSEGGSAGDAARFARQQMIDDGFSAAAWAAIVVLGDDTGTVDRPATPWANPFVVVTLCFGLLATGTTIAWRRSKRRSVPPSQQRS